MSNNKILVIGENGQVGGFLKTILGDKSISLTREQLDLVDISEIKTKLDQYQFDGIINAAAYTKVDDAEDYPDLANKINTLAPLELAKYCKNKDIPFIHYSTDYVFDGNKVTSWLEEDSTNPLSIYGRTKLSGENNIKQIGGKYLIFRTSWVYGEKGNNFLNTMLRLGREKELINVVSDQFGCPTYAKDLAYATLEALEKAKTLATFPSGIYHLCNSNVTSWYLFAREIFEIANLNGIKLSLRELKQISSSEFPTKATRPKNSLLSCTKIKNILDIEMRNWQDALKDCMSRLNN